MKNIHAPLLLMLAANAHGQFSYHHAFTLGSAAYDSGQDIAVDANGNVYVVGGFSAAFDADPGPLTTPLTPIGDDMFLAKYNDAGALQWAFRAGGSGFDAGYGIEVMGTTVYVTGTYNSADADLDPGPGTGTLPVPADADVFVARYDLNGTFISAFGIGGGDSDVAVDIEVAANGDFAICGNFESTDMDADPGAGVDLLSTVAGVDAFLIKFSAGGTLVFGHAFGGGGTLDSDRALGLHMATSGDVYVTGSFSSTGGDFDPGPGSTTLNSMGSIDIFISKFNSAGVLQWAQRIGDTGGHLGYGLETDGDGNLYFCGYANSASIDLDPGPAVETFTSGEGQDIVAVKLDPAGGYLWGLRIGGGSSDIGFTTVIDDQDHLFLAGNFGDANVDFGPGSGTSLLSSSSAFETDMFLAQFDLSGNFVDAVDMGHTGTDAIWNVALASNGRLWTVGNKTGIVDADPGPGTALLDSLGSADIFVGAYDHVHAVGLEELEDREFVLYPNPARDRVTVDLHTSGPARIELQDAAGGTLLVQDVTSFPVDLDLRNVRAGIHTVHLYDGDSHRLRKLLKVR